MKTPKKHAEKVLQPWKRAARHTLHPLRGGAAKTKRNKKTAPYCASGARTIFIVDARKSAPPRTTPKKRQHGAVFRLKRQTLHMLHTYINKNKIYIYIYIGGYIGRGVDHRGAKKRGGGR